MADSGCSVVPEQEREIAYGRYRVERRLGEGGMAVVYEALDRSAGRRIALKRLRDHVGPRSTDLVRLFRQEFLALAQLAHPRIVAVYDYGADARGPYYTMELLDGGDLRRVAPGDFRTACALARDVCSALSLVHSRRMVYRDLSPSNVRCSSDGVAKLIDFGGLTPMGPAQDMVGTLPCVPPEALNQQPLDARTDLYALGATLYFALVNRYAFPARNVAELKQLWQQRPRAPSLLVPGIPPALDQLVLDLIELDPAHRPDSAAVVMERLSVIAQLPHDESLLVRQAYLATPQLVDRESILNTVREHIARVRSGRGGSLVVAGASGMGRSRLLEVGALEAKLAGVLVLRADAQSTNEDYAAARSLARDLLHQAPALARACAAPHLAPVLMHVVPELCAGTDAQSPGQSDDPAELNRRIQQALREWLCAIAKHEPLLLTVDDIDRIDVPSATFVALLARDAARYPLLVLASQGFGTVQPQTARGALQILQDQSTVLTPTPLDIEASEQLLSSVFGRVPHLAQAAHHIHRITNGVPRDILLLAQHLVSEGFARYQVGAWSLPEHLSATDLPGSMSDALLRRVRKLSPEACKLAYATIVEPTFRFSLSECSALIDVPEARIGRIVKELVEAEFATTTAVGVRATPCATSAPFTGECDADARKRLHLSLSALCRARADLLRSAQHLYKANESERGLHLLIEHAIESSSRTRVSLKEFYNFLRTLPGGWFATYRQALSDCDRYGCPPKDKCVLLLRLSGILSQTGADTDGYIYQEALLGRLAHDCGLDRAAEAPASPDAASHAKRVLAEAQARYQGTPESAQGLDPVTALKHLGAHVVTCLGVLAYTNDYRAWERLPSLAPLSPLSPALPVVTELVQAVGLRIGGRSEDALARYEHLLARFDAPDRGGLEPAYHQSARVRIVSAIGLLEATLGRDCCLEKAASLAKMPRHESVALQIRQLYALFQGNLPAARHAEQQVELLRLESNATHPSEAQFAFNALYAHVLANDLTGIRRSIEALAPRAEHYDAFRAALAFARGAHERIRGNATEALSELSAALGLMEPGQHVLWGPAAAAQLRTLLELSRVDEAYRLGKDYIALGDKLGHSLHQVQLAFALVLNARGDSDGAVALADEALRELLRKRIGGLNLAVAYEARAHLASELGDHATFRRLAALHGAIHPSGNRRLRELGSGDGQADEVSVSTHVTLEQLKSTLESCHSRFERAVLGLEFLGRPAGALAGVLFEHTDGVLRRSAWFGELAQDRAIDTWADAFFRRELTEHVTEEMDPLSAAGLPSEGTSVPYVATLLGHYQDGVYGFTGLAVFVAGDPNVLRLAFELTEELSRALAHAEDAA